MQAVIFLLCTIGFVGIVGQLRADDGKCGYFDEVQMHKQDSFAVPTEHQWLARIAYSDNNHQVPTGGCMAVLISKRSLLAPAHCFVRFESKPEAFSVHLGVWNKTADVNQPTCLNGYCVLPAQEIKLAEISIHPEYDPLTFKNSLAVLTLQKDAKLTANVQPVCMPPPSVANDTLVGQMFMLAGIPVNKVLKNKSWVKTVSTPWCQSKHNSLLTSSTMVCGYLQQSELYHLGAPIVAVQVEGDLPKNFYLVGLQMDVLRVPNTQRYVASFLDVRPYLEYINNNAIFDLK
ncbi:transmembrane protease serine 9 [Scaptodrosophila lebanonensis]|uniref:Transmembrane protease serine 9 n=1 Tax=Drosophila lebanonensis TaxID=7225 RepID=A0A6J2T9Y4_DROLE|nr:transmembrane protease serine 9 [Scaptodrosophila lebanonensis]